MILFVQCSKKSTGPDIETNTIYSINITTSANGQRMPSDTLLSVSMGDTIYVYAAGYNKDGAFVSNVPVTWHTEGNCSLKTSDTLGASVACWLKSCGFGYLAVKINNLVDTLRIKTVSNAVIISDINGVALGDSVTLFVGQLLNLVIPGCVIQGVLWSLNGNPPVGNYYNTGQTNVFTAAMPGVGCLVASSMDSVRDSIKIVIYPASPTALKSNSIYYSAIKLDWTDTKNTNLLGYRIYMSLNANGSGATLLGVVGSAIRTYTVDSTKVAWGTKYYFFVTAYDQVNSVTYESYMSNIIDDAPTFISEAIQIGTRVSAYQSALDLSASVVYSLIDQTNGGPNADIWLDNIFYINGCDNGAGAGSSPLSPAWTRDTYVYDMGVYAMFDDAVSVAPAFPGAGWANQAVAVSGHVYALRTDDGNFVKLRVDYKGIDYIRVTTSHQDVTNYTNFKAASK
jgi:hypothetical protein